MDVVAVESTNDVVCLELSGRMDTSGVERTETRFFALFAPRGVGTVIDLTKVSVLTSMGLRLIISGAKTARAKGFRIALVAPAGPVRDVLDDASIGDLLPILDDRAAARSLVQGAGGTGR
jgi:anti-sigma B factor antagonist